MTIVGVGFCGACTPFSTFSYELILLSRKVQTEKAVLYAASSLVVGPAAAAAGLAVGSFGQGPRVSAGKGSGKGRPGPSGT
ncbi:CrcB family protein [Streptomyces sp. NPDC002133]|uniref:FluC/FEX family fluoride channel n=1 Tax=Streptomyces sp. NPDC002133 TaxID=3154409 RepID=UPI003326A2D2